MIRILVFFLLACFSLTVSAETRYFNSEGEPVTREEYEKLKEEWYEYLAENKEKPRARVRYVKPDRQPAVSGTAHETVEEPEAVSGGESEIPEWILRDSAGGSSYGGASHGGAFSGGGYSPDDPSVERGTYAPSGGGGGGQPKRDEAFGNKLRLMR